MSDKSIFQDLADALEQATQHAATSSISFVDFLRSKDFCGLELSPAIQAIAEASEGLPITTLDADTILKIFGSTPPQIKKRIVVIGAGGRSGKTSRLLAPKCIHAAWTVPLPFVASGERARALLVAPKRDLAAQAFSIVKGIIKASKILSDALVEERAESLVLRRPDGLEVEIFVGSANRGGQDARGRTLVFLGMDEAAFFRNDDYEVNDREIFEAAEQRLVPGAQAWVVSTPWVESIGLMETLISTDWGKHDSALVAARVSTRLLNPTWDQDHEIERAMRKRPDGEANVQREIYAIPFTRGSTAFFDILAIADCLTHTPPTNLDVVEKGAGVDLGFKNDHSAVVIVSRLRGGHFRVDIVEEKKPQPGAPLQPSIVRSELASTIKRNGISSVMADGFSASDTQEQFGNHNLRLIEAPGGAEGKLSVYNAAREVIHNGRLYVGHLPPEIRDSLSEQLKSIIRRPTTAGKYEISAPRKKLSETGGGHADAVSALVLALWQAGARVGETFANESKVSYKAPRWSESQSVPTNRGRGRDQLSAWARKGRS